MAVDDFILYHLARRWPSPVADRENLDEEDAGTEEYGLAYAQHQFNRKTRTGVHSDVAGLDILEIGCGHGGICCFLAITGARSVTGIDVNPRNLSYAEKFAEQVSARFGSDYKLPVRFLEMSADRLEFPDASFDLLIADNAFEHFDDPEAVLREAYRILRPGGGLVVPTFSSIYSKYALHLKHGLKLPWANLFFSDRAIVRAMHRLAKDTPKILEIYPGLANNPKSVRDLRAHRDLNNITYRTFKSMVRRTGFHTVRFRLHPTNIGKIVSRMPILRSSPLTEVFSTGAEAYLRKHSQ